MHLSSPWSSCCLRPPLVLLSESWVRLMGVKTPVHTHTRMYTQCQVNYFEHTKCTEPPVHTHRTQTHTHPYSIPECLPWGSTISDHPPQPHTHTPALLLSLCLFPHEHFTLCVCVCVLSGFFNPICAALFIRNSDYKLTRFHKASRSKWCSSSSLFLHIMFSFLSQSYRLLLKTKHGQKEYAWMEGRKQTHVIFCFSAGHSYSFPTSCHSKGQRLAASEPPPAPYTHDTSCWSCQGKAASGGRAAGPASLITRYHWCLTTLLLTWSLRAEIRLQVGAVTPCICQASLPPPCHPWSI